MSRDTSAFARHLCSSGAHFGTAGAFSLAINLLYLAGPLYMLQVYDRVVPSGSQLTLLMLTLVLLLAYLALAGLDAARARVLTRASVRLDRQIAPRVMTAMIDRGSSPDAARDHLLQDFDTFRQFISGSGVHALFDLPWAPIYIGVIFMLHWMMGAFALGCAAVLVLMAWVNEQLVRAPLTDANAAASRNYNFTAMSLRNVASIRAMGMTEGLLNRWAVDRDRTLERQVAASDLAAAMQSVIKFLRLSMQSLILGLGAYLVIERDVSAGAMFAASLLLGRALQPVEQVVGGWRGLVSARGAFRRLTDLFAETPPAELSLALPRPVGKLSVENLCALIPGTNRALLRGVSFAIEAGEVLGVVGPSGAGKSSLSRHLVGALTPAAGAVRLDGADVSAWARKGLGEHVGYLPQEIELFADTIAANINRFRPGDDGAVIRAAQMAGVHELILRLPKGYETQIGDGGTMLSGGVRQRIALARAVYGTPSLVVLDEPSSNLDGQGDLALSQCIQHLKDQKVSVVLVSHRPHTVNVADKLLVLQDGAVATFGSRAEVLERLHPRPQSNLAKAA